MRSHCALRVAVSRDALDRVGRRLANGRSELDAEHLHAAWRASLSLRLQALCHQARQPHHGPPLRSGPLGVGGVASAESSAVPGR
eukprot:scaffold15872_cov27-Phaeocystis_antarctica.AAC.1